MLPSAVLFNPALLPITITLSASPFAIACEPITTLLNVVIAFEHAFTPIIILLIPVVRSLAALVPTIILLPTP